MFYQVKKGMLRAQPKRATLRNDPTQAVRYTVENGGGNAAVFHLHRYRPADKPQGGWGTESPRSQAANLSSKKMANCAYARPQSLTGMVHFLAISFVLR